MSYFQAVLLSVLSLPFQLMLMFVYFSHDWTIVVLKMDNNFTYSKENLQVLLHCWTSGTLQISLKYVMESRDAVGDVNVYIRTCIIQVLEDRMQRRQNIVVLWC